MEMDPLAVVLPQFALDEALAENEARREGDDARDDLADNAQEGGEGEPDGAA